MLTRKQGFSIVEILVVMAMLSILAIGAVTAYTSYSVNANFAEVLSLMNELKVEIATSYSETDSFPTTVKGLTIATYNSVAASYNRINVIYYNKATDNSAAYFHFFTTNLGILNAVAADASGNGAVSARITMVLARSANNNFVITCGVWNGGASDIPLSYLPSACKSTNLSAMIA